MIDFIISANDIKYLFAYFKWFLGDKLQDSGAETEGATKGS